MCFCSTLQLQNEFPLYHDHKVHGHGSMHWSGGAWPEVALEEVHAPRNHRLTAPVGERGRMVFPAGGQICHQVLAIFYRGWHLSQCVRSRNGIPSSIKVKQTRRGNGFTSARSIVAGNVAACRPHSKVQSRFKSWCHIPLFVSLNEKRPWPIQGPILFPGYCCLTPPTRPILLPAHCSRGL